MTRPERIQAMRDRLGEIGRASKRFRAALALSNDPAHQRYFKDLLDRIDLIIANESLGATRELGGDLSKARQDLRRLQLPELDPDLEESTPALTALRGERGNLVEAMENGVDAAHALGLEPRMSEFGELQVPRAAFESTLIRLDERLRNVEENVRGLAEATAATATQQTNMAVDQRGLLNLQIASLTVQVGAARAETRTGRDPAIPLESDVAALARAAEAIRDIARDVKATADELAGWVTPNVRIVGGLLARSAERVAGGVRGFVGVILRRLRTRKPVDHTAESSRQKETPPADFDPEAVKRMVLAGQAPPATWVPFIDQLVLRSYRQLDLSAIRSLSALNLLDLAYTQVTDITPLSGLSALTALQLAGTKVTDLSSLASLSALASLNLTDAKVTDLSPLAGLSALTSLNLNGTEVADLSPLGLLSALSSLSLAGTRVTDISPLAGLSALTSLDLQRTQVRDLSPIATLSNLISLKLIFTQVTDLAPLAGLHSMKELSLGGTRVADLSPLGSLHGLASLDLRRTEVNDLSPLSGLHALTSLSLSATQLLDLSPLNSIEGLIVKIGDKQLKAPFARHRA